MKTADIIQLSFEGVVNSGGWIYVPRHEVKGLCIYLALLTDPERDNCFSIYQISWIKIKRQLFAN